MCSVLTTGHVDITGSFHGLFSVKLLFLQSSLEPESQIYPFPSMLVINCYRLLSALAHLQLFQHTSTTIDVKKIQCFKDCLESILLAQLFLLKNHGYSSVKKHFGFANRVLPKIVRS